MKTFSQDTWRTVFLFCFWINNIHKIKNYDLINYLPFNFCHFILIILILGHLLPTFFLLISRAFKVSLSLARSLQFERTNFVRDGIYLRNIRVLWVRLSSAKDYPRLNDIDNVLKRGIINTFVLLCRFSFFRTHCKHSGLQTSHNRRTRENKHPCGSWMQLSPVQSREHGSRSDKPHFKNRSVQKAQ